MTTTNETATPRPSVGTAVACKRRYDPFAEHMERKAARQRNAASTDAPAEPVAGGRVRMECAEGMVAGGSGMGEGDEEMMEDVGSIETENGVAKEGVCDAGESAESGAEARSENVGDPLTPPVVPMTPARLERLRGVAELAYRTKYNEAEAVHAMQIFERLCCKWCVDAEIADAIWRDLEERSPELKAGHLLRRMAKLLRKHLDLRRKVKEELRHWKPFAEQQIDLGAVALVERVDRKAAKYLLSLDEDDFTELYQAKAKKRAAEGAVKRKKGGTKEPDEKEVLQLLHSDRKRLRHILVEFLRGKGAVKRKYNFKSPKTFGRRFAHGGLQGVWGAFRCVLANGQCTDFDMKNAHPTLLLWVCDTLRIDCPKLRHYVQHRDEVLSAMAEATQSKRHECKRNFLVAVNDGRLLGPSRFHFFNQFDAEMKSIHVQLVRHPDYAWLHAYVSEKDENYSGVFVNLILCYWENVLLEYAVAYFRRHELEVQVLMFDGCMVGKEEPNGTVTELDAEECFEHCAILREIGRHVLGLDVTWAVKPLVDERLAVPKGFDPRGLLPVFEELTESFDEVNKKVGENYVTINRDGTFSIRNKEKFKDYHNHIGMMNECGQRSRFVTKWVDDYDDIPFYEKCAEYPPGGPPDRSQCPDDHFNVWERFDFEKWDPALNPDGTSFVHHARAVEMFRDMVMGLVGDNRAHFVWFMQWLYTCLKHPATKSARCPFFISRQGCGKDTLVKILQKLFGYMRCVTESDPSENLWGKFNEVLAGTYLIILTEVGFADFAQGLGRAKHLIAEYEYTLNYKGGAKVKKMTSFHRFMGITNIGSQGEITPVPVTDDERRILLFLSSARLMGNHVFWNEMYEEILPNWSAIRSILAFILTFEHAPTFSNDEVPRTEFQRSATTVHPIKQFVRDYAHESTINGVHRVSCYELWEEYKAWCRDANVQLGHMTKQAFGIKLSRFAIPGVSAAVLGREGDSVRQVRLLDFTAIRDTLPLEEASEGYEAVSEAPRESDAGNLAEAPTDAQGVWDWCVSPADRKRDEELKATRLDTFRSAGVILYHREGYWLGLQRKDGKRYWADYGECRQGDETPWETAVRACQNEAGVDIRGCILKRAPDFHSESQAKHVVFWVETRVPPVQDHSAAYLKHTLNSRWPVEEVHPRLRYDKGFLLAASRQALGFQ